MEFTTKKTKVITDFTFYTGMYEKEVSQPVKICSRYEPLDLEEKSPNVRRVDQEYPKEFNHIRSKVHPRVNLPVFRRKQKLKVFSVESKDRKNVKKLNMFPRR